MSKAPCHDEAIAAHCLVSMANKEPQSSDPPPQCDGPHSASANENERRSNDTTKLESIKNNIIPASDLPSSNQWKNEKYSSTPGDSSCSEMVWDSNKARVATRQVNILESIVPHDRKELALKLFHENGYEIYETLLAKVMEAEPSNGINWSPANKRVFSTSITKGTKNFTTVSKRLNKNSGDCQSYYYSHFKQTSDYRKMKRAIRRQERRQVKTRSSSANATDLSE
mmetsp:Transcript_15943/g.33684  ORF Transcript_15943/g.33684 Transcript_15943/m.33684 type:complete len:226 (-) Transcript_15943:217-894(-)